MSLTHALHEFKSFDRKPVNAYHESQLNTNGNRDMKTNDSKINGLGNDIGDFIDYRHFDQVARSLRAKRFAEVSIQGFIEKFSSSLKGYGRRLAKVTRNAIGNPGQTDCERSPAGCL